MTGINNDPEVVLIGSSYLRILSNGFIAYGLGMVMVNALDGAGEVEVEEGLVVPRFQCASVPRFQVVNS